MTTHIAPNMKVAALALLVAGVASASVESHKKASMKKLNNLTRQELVKLQQH